ncbi:hypothetical protein G9A89_021673 [Geosiphon pyriformis]|nr:hypothetical protein G9A89_021673 [Geosiphon pyriformis]
MKISAILFATLTSAVSANSDQRLLATLAEKWNLTDPTFSYDSNSFNLTFPVTDFIGTGMSNFSLWTAPGCQSDGGTSLTTDDVWSSAPRLVENTDLSTGSSLDSGAFAGRNATIVAAFDPQKVSTSVIYNDTSVTGQGASAQIRFCMRFGVWTTEAMGVTTPVEVNFLETLVTLTVNLTSGFEIGAINVAPKNRLVRTANQAYEVRGYECSAGSFTELSTADKDRPRNQGEIIHVCVTPQADALTDGIFMRSVDKFEFNRDTTIRQSAIEDNAAAGNLLTTYTPADCQGAKVCRFSTILFAQFYATPGQVAGSGTASMQFGGNARRQLRAERDLQAADAAGTAEFDLNFQVAQAEAQSDSGAGSTSMGAAVTMAAVAAVAALL